MKLFVRIIQFLLALNLIALGVALYIKADIGVGPWDVLHNNLYDFYQLTVGTWVFIVGILAVLISLLLHYDVKSFLAIITSFIVSKLIDYWLTLIIDDLSLYIRIPLFFFSLFLLGFGISLLVLTKLPPTPPEILMISLTKRFKINYAQAKTMTEIMAFILAIIIGFINGKPFNNIGIGTLLTITLIGFIIQISSRFWNRIFTHS